jgi:ribosome-associated protein
MNITKADLQKEVSYKTSRSGGKGGQNVNKVSSKVELLFPIQTSLLFSDEEKALLLGKLQSRFNKDGLLQVVCDEERSQYLNKEIALERLISILSQALIVPKIRKKVKIPKSLIAARLNNKKKQADKKESRRKGFEY